MKFAAVLIVFSFGLITSDAQRGFSLKSIIDLVSPPNPQLHRVRRIEDAYGDPAAVLDTVGLIEQYGYPAEQHNFTTDDGYNIVIFRMPGSPTSPPAKGKRIVFLQHGMLASSDSWALMGPKTDLIFTLADAGYDVWMGNIRGNTYCRTHTNLTTANKEFWDFSWHDMAILDVSKAISYALEHSGQKKLFYIGHSMGTTMSYVLLSERPEYNEKMYLVISLAPSAYWKHPSNALYQLSIQFSTMLKTVLMDGLGKYDLFPQSKTTGMLVQMLCGNRSPMQSLCLTLFELGVGQGIEPLNITALPYLTSYFPAGTSGKTMYHYAQCLKGGYLQKYDFGRAKNLIVYGTENSPLYNLSMISAPVALIYGNTDALALPPNIIALSKLLPNVATCEAVPTPVFSHMDFIVSSYAKELVYNRILELFTLYTKD